MITEFKELQTKDGEKLHLSIVENGSPKWIIVTHGLGEHGGRHKYFFKLFSQYFNICTWDLRGHGKSSGKRGFVENFSDFTSDLDEVRNFLSVNYQMKDYILFGHSMGALITASYMQKRVKESHYPKKVFLSGPPVAASGALGKIFELAPLGFTKSLADLSSSAPLGGMLDIKKLSHDPRVYEAYIKDELNILKIHTKLFFNILAEAKDVFSRPLRVNCELYVATGTKDVLINPQALIRYFEKVEKNAILYKCEDAYHEIHNEIEKFKKPYFDFLKNSILGEY